MKEESSKIAREDLKELITEVIKKNTPKTNCIELYGVRVSSDDISLLEVANVFQQIVDINKELISQKSHDSKIGAHYG